MPEEWQLKFVELLDDLSNAFDHIEHPETFKVITGDLRELRGMTGAEIESIGYSVFRGDPDLDEDDVFCNESGTEVNADMSAEMVCYPMPDPIPHYNRGRTHIEPCIDQKSYAILLKTNGDQVSYAFEGDKPTLEELQNAVNGHISYVTPNNLNGHTTLVVNEEGESLQLNFNSTASSLAGITLYGDVLMVETRLVEN
jgi:hypothetical protein